jgi:hypothetical protein
MSARVDVLAAMREALDTITWPPDEERLITASAAVAELIKAANCLLSATSKAYCSWPTSDAKREAWNQLNNALRAAVAADPYIGVTGDAVAAAIANIGPAS